MVFKRNKYIDVLTYIIAKTTDKKNVGKTVLANLLYSIDFNYYELYGKLLTKETYIKSRKGIKPQHFNDITQELTDKNQLFLRKEPYYNRILHRYYLTIIPQAKFSEKEQEIIDLSINNLSNHNASSIAKYTRNDPPFNIAHLGEKIDCRYVFSRNNNYSMRKIKLKNK